MIHTTHSDLITRSIRYGIELHKYQILSFSIQQRENMQEIIDVIKFIIK